MKRASTHWLIALASALPYIRIVKNWAFFLVLSLQAADRLTATGKVLDEITKQPIGNATVMVYSAGVKTGFDLFCPTCYVDCGKRAATDENGEFRIAGLSGDLIFNLLVVREGFVAKMVKQVDPAQGTAPTTEMKKRLAPEDASQTVLGKILDATGKPVKDALIAQQDVIFDQGRMFGADDQWIDPISVSNALGEFEMSFSEKAKAMILEVAPRGMAPKMVTLDTGTGRHRVTVTDGAVVKGRLMNGKTPVANTQLVLSTHSRAGGSVFKDVRIGTNENGEFAISNVPAGRVWDLFPAMNALATMGLAAPVTFVATEDDGQEVQAGDIQVKPAHTLRGRIVLSDGSPIPAGMRLSIFADRVPDRQTVDLPPDGTYEFKGLGRGVYSLSPAVKGYRRDNPDQQVEIVIDGDRKAYNLTLIPSSGTAKR